MSSLDSQNQSSRVRTMRDDLEALKNNTGKNVSAPAKNDSVPTPHPVSVSAPFVNPFQSDIEKNTEKVPVTNTQSVRPSVTTEQTVDQTMKPTVQKKSVQKWASPDSSDEDVVSDTQKSKKVLWIGVIMMSVLLLCGGIGYYFIVMQGSPEPNIEPTQHIDVPAVEQVISQELPYSLDTANFLSINTEIISAEEIKNILFATSARIREASITQPVEFLITDQNNNKLAFSRFALLLKLELDPVILSHIDESFSLYLYNDDGKMRVGLDLLLKDQSAVIPLLSKGENMLPYAFRMLILEQNSIVPKSMSFKSNVYSTRPLTSEPPIAIRYVNIDIAQNVSMDYAITENHWYIGTSKNTLTAILGKNVQ